MISLQRDLLCDVLNNPLAYRALSADDVLSVMNLVEDYRQFVDLLQQRITCAWEKRDVGCHPLHAAMRTLGDTREEVAKLFDDDTNLTTQELLRMVVTLCSAEVAVTGLERRVAEIQAAMDCGALSVTLAAEHAAG